MTVQGVWLVLYWAWIASEVLLVLITHTRGSSGGARDRGSLFILWPTIFLSIWAAMQYGYTHPHTMFPGHPQLQHELRLVALALLIAGLALRWTAILSLGRSFSVNVAIHPAQTVHRRGLYRLVRHPSYSGMLVIFIALGVDTRNWLALAIVLVPPSLALIYRIHVEENALRAAFGPEYVEYSRTTKRLIPGLF